MAKKANSTTFKPGHRPVSSGRPKLPKDVLAMRGKATDDFMRSLYETLNMTNAELREANKNPDTPAYQRSQITAIRSSIRGNAKATEIIWERAYGKPQQPITGDPDAPIHIHLKWPESEK